MLAVLADVVKTVMLETAESSRVKENEDNDYLRITHTIGFMTMLFSVFRSRQHVFLLLRIKKLAEIMGHQ